MKLLGGKYVLAPMAMKPKLILDVACGTGIWVGYSPYSWMINLLSGS